MRNSVFVIIVIFLLGATGFAGDAAEYHRRVETARIITAELTSDLVLGRRSESGSDFDALKIVQIRTILPASEIIETDHGEIEISNRWLHSRLDEFVTDPTFITRGAILSDIEERLAAISWKITEAEIAAKSDRSKTEDKQKLDEILAREDFRGTTQQDRSAVQWFIDQILEFFDRLLSGVQPAVSRTPSSMPYADGIRVVILLVLIGLIGFGLYKFAPFIFRLKRGRKSGDADARIILGERIGPEATTADLLSEAETLANSGDLRGAIRKGYIALLLALNDSGLIRLAAHKTNRDYLRDLRGEGELQQLMNNLTLSFERHWYGLQPAEKSAFEEFRRSFSAFAKHPGKKGN